MKDTDPMPFGKYKGKPMSDVPVSYLHWLWNNGLMNEPNKPVHQYIKNNIDALQMEAPDLIWDKV